MDSAFRVSKGRVSKGRVSKGRVINADVQVGSQSRTLMGMPVQWKPNGKRQRLPSMRWNPTANSTLEMVKLWPRWRRPFMYGYGNVTTYVSL